jgi:hypothetical protein
MKTKSMVYISSKLSSKFKTLIFDEKLMSKNLKFDEMMSL